MTNYFEINVILSNDLNQFCLILSNDPNQALEI